MFLAESPSKRLHGSSSSRERRFGEHTRPRGVVPGVLAGHNARVNVDAGYPYFAKPLRNVVHLVSRCCPAGTPANYTRGRLCSPSHAMEDFPYERRRLSSRAFPSSGVRNYLVTVAAISKLRPCDSGGTRENRESGRCPDECEGVHLR